MSKKIAIVEQDRIDLYEDTGRKFMSEILDMRYAI